MNKFLLLFVIGSSSLFGIDYIAQCAVVEKRLIAEICQEYGLSVTGSGGGYMAEYNSVSVDFNYPGPLTIEKARELFIKIKEKFADGINSCYSLRPHMHRYPFSAQEDIHILLSSYDYKNHRRYPESGVDLVCLGQEKVFYIKYDNGECFGRDVLEEPYEEARKAVLGESERVALKS